METRKVENSSNLCVWLIQNLSSIMLVLSIQTLLHEYYLICRENEMKNSMLSQILDQSARARCKMKCFSYLEL